MIHHIAIPELMTFGEISRHFGEAVRARRDARGLSRRKLSEVSGVSVPTISRLELKGTCSLDALIKLAQGLGCVEDLLNAFPAPKYNSMEEYLKAHGANE